MGRNVIRMISRVFVVVFIGIAGAQHAFAQEGISGPKRTYVWFAELVSFDLGTKAATVKAPLNEAVVKYIDRSSQASASCWAGQRTTRSPKPGQSVTSRPTKR